MSDADSHGDKDRESGKNGGHSHCVEPSVKGALGRVVRVVKYSQISGRFHLCNQVAQPARASLVIKIRTDSGKVLIIHKVPKLDAAVV